MLITLNNYNYDLTGCIALYCNSYLFKLLNKNVMIWNKATMTLPIGQYYVFFENEYNEEFAATHMYYVALDTIIMDDKPCSESCK